MLEKLVLENCRVHFFRKGFGVHDMFGIGLNVLQSFPMLKIGIIPPVPVFRTYFLALPVVSSQDVSDRVGRKG